LVGILCGIPPYPALRVVAAQQRGIPVHCLPDLLKSHGYETAFFQPATENYEDRDVLVNNLGFETFVSLEDLAASRFERVNYFGVEDRAMLGPSRKWLNQTKGAPFVATYLTLATHHDYGENAVETQVKYTENERKNDYLNALRSVDNFIGGLIEQYKELGLFSNTLFVIVGDHGQAFGEHDRNFHAGVLYDEGIRVPLVVYGADLERPAQRMESPVSTLSVLPTVLELLGYRAPKDVYSAESLLDHTASRNVYFHTHYSSALGMRAGPMKYIKYGPTSSAELYDLSKDPDESENLADTLPDMTSRFGTKSRLYWERVRQIWDSAQSSK
jgi:phosphoglycerol transferase MdoB-like AlkP superfamily enzyme